MGQCLRLRIAHGVLLSFRIYSVHLFLYKSVQHLMHWMASMFHSDSSAKDASGRGRTG